MSIQPASDTDGDPAPPPQPAEEPPSLAQPRPLPQSVLTIDDLAFRQRATDAWRAASQLRRLMEQWGAWFYHLETSGYADSGLALHMYEAVAVCVRALCSVGVCMRTFSGTAPEELLGRFPRYPWPLKDPPWQQDEEYRRQTRELLRHEGWRPLMGELLGFLQMLETAPSVAFQPAPPSRRTAAAAPRGRRMTVEEAEASAREVYEREGVRLIGWSLARQARAVGCHADTWEQTPLYGELYPTGHPGKRRGDKRPRAVSLTSKMEAAAAGPPEALEDLVEEQERERRADARGRGPKVRRQI
jgi:hypothetical protein